MCGLHQARVWSVVSTESHIYSCGADKTVIVWSAADALRGVSTPIARFSGHVDVVYALQIAFGSLFSSSADKTIKRCAEITPRSYSRLAACSPFFSAERTTWPMHEQQQDSHARSAIGTTCARTRSR